MSTRKNFFLMALAALLATGVAFAGTSDVDRLDVRPEHASGDALRVLQNDKTEIMVIEEDGTVDLSGANDVALGSVAISQATSRTVFIPAGEFRCAATAGCTEGEQTAKVTLVFADSSADDHAYVTWGLPDDFDLGGSFIFVQIVYNMPSGTPGEGEWDLKYVAIADDDADAAPGSELTVLDTPAAADDWNVTSAIQIPIAAVGASDKAVVFDLYHDVSDAFGGSVEVLGLLVTYTSDSNL